LVIELKPCEEVYIYKTVIGGFFVNEDIAFLEQEAVVHDYGSV